MEREELERHERILDAAIERLEEERKKLADSPREYEKASSFRSKLKDILAAGRRKVRSSTLRGSKTQREVADRKLREADRRLGELSHEKNLVQSQMKRQGGAGLGVSR